MSKHLQVFIALVALLVFIGTPFVMQIDRMTAQPISEPQAVMVVALSQDIEGESYVAEVALLSGKRLLIRPEQGVYAQLNTGRHVGLCQWQGGLLGLPYYRVLVVDMMEVCG